MANNYALCTVTPKIPTDKITDFELSVLTIMGFQYENYREGENFYYYFYSEEGVCAENIAETDYDDFSEATVEDKVLYYKDGDIANDFDEAYVFQNILKRAELKEIIIEGCWYCDKMRMGEFGGFVVYITADKIQCGSTATLINDFRNSSE